MPTYRYRCESCGDEFEVWQSITDDALSTHDASITDASTDGDCGGHVVKVLSPAGIVLKGSGFYKTDSRSQPASKNGDGAKDSSSKEGGSKEGSSKEGGSKTSDSGTGSKADSSSGTKDGGSSGSSSSGSGSKPSSTTSSS